MWLRPTPPSHPKATEPGTRSCAGFEVLGIHLEIDAKRGAIVLADGVNGFRIAEAAFVFGKRRRIEEAQPLLGFRKLLLDEPVGVRTHHALGQIVGLNIEEPVPGERAPLPADVVEQVMLRDDIEDRRARDFLRVVEAHAMQDTRAAVMARRIKIVEAERLHHLDLILRHRAER